MDPPHSRQRWEYLSCDHQVSSQWRKDISKEIRLHKLQQRQARRERGVQLLSSHFLFSVSVWGEPSWWEDFSQKEAGNKEEIQFQIGKEEARNKEEIEIQF